MRERCSVPARVGGVDLSVPARVGGVDLSSRILVFSLSLACPRPCGRGGFKLGDLDRALRGRPSPPVWAGWI